MRMKPSCGIQNPNFICLPTSLILPVMATTPKILGTIEMKLWQAQSNHYPFEGVVNFSLGRLLRKFCWGGWQIHLDWISDSLHKAHNLLEFDTAKALTNCISCTEKSLLAAVNSCCCGLQCFKSIQKYTYINKYVPIIFLNIYIYIC